MSNLILEARKAISKKFDIPLEEMIAIPFEGKTAVLHGAEAGKYRGSWDDIMNAPAKEYTVKIDGKEYDTRKAMDFKLYKEFAEQAEKKPDISTWTLLTGEPITEFIKAYWSTGKGVPGGDWGDSQVRSGLYQSDNQYDDVRPRLAVILDCPFDPCVSSCSLPDEITIEGRVYKAKK